MIHSKVSAENFDSLPAWDLQIRLFARYFLSYARLPKDPFTLLNMGCGTGSALAEIKRIYPKSILHGCDLQDVHVEISRNKNGKIANFYQSDIESINDHYDIIYISNVIEHIETWKKAIDIAATHCDRLYILVPYKELMDINFSCLKHGVDHVSSFDKSSFIYLKEKGYSVEFKVLRTPFAGGHPWKMEIYLRLKSAIKGTPYQHQRELLVAITDFKKRNNFLRKQPFLSRLQTVFNLMLLPKRK